MPTDVLTKDSGIYMGSAAEQGNFSTKNVIEDFMKTEYQEGLRNEFNTMDALLNKLSKDTITGKVKYKSFALGITDNVRAVGSGTYDTYQLGFEDFYGKGVDTVEAQFDTTKLMATFAITDEAMLKGTGDGSLLDVLKDSLDRMEIGLKHTFNRYTYGGADGIIGKISEPIVLQTLTAKEASTKPLDPRGSAHNDFYGAAPLMIKFSMTNSHSLIAGMGAMIQVDTVASKKITASKRYIGRIFQKDNSDITKEVVWFVVEKVATATVADSTITGWSVAEASTDNVLAVTPSDTVVATVYSRQLNNARVGIAEEYHGLEDIVVRQDNILFGINRALYPSLKCASIDMEGTKYLNEETLRDLSDHLALTSPEGTAINLVCANHRIISNVEKSMYQFKNYNLDSVQNGLQLGGKGEIRFDNFVLVKDKYARDNNVYMLDQTKIGELVRRDFTWITSGEVNGVLQRRPGTEMYEGIMNKYADMYIDAWKCHAVIKNCKVHTGGYLSYGENGLPIAG